MIFTAPIIATGTGCTLLRAANWLAPLQSACDKYAINAPLRIAAFLATIGVESGEMQWTAEIWGPTAAQKAYEPPSRKASELGNTQKGDGLRFKGRGLVQITGRRNYMLAAMGLELDLLNHPELLEQPGNAAMSAAWYWANRNLNALADAGNFLGLSRAVNLGSASSTATPNGWTQRAALYAAAKQAMEIA
ncbi:glycoside hydrolase family 19 protein [Burkholderia pseudomallei]|uniref:glycoside hydrolase family 19 protein n=1 Tax=Burkholderia pseudomallei TaxID=28450 RepID=UPI000F04BA62|nr:glycoside hydrolase family 19 protein [Burkholderia pseudomallei]CAJ2712277.1 glycoside hydrolase family protein [Burkholderia pseudomallei]CAJ4673583.1 glycoside hydrolase family protein [Burkholderia pseudomallei]VBM95039.1 glycoside hydrolase family protein [Burkholderia pseudomallei]VBX79338.1 glycoside hydrolase family protein [Burkholderia pseudomallei]VBX79362.1 glycoside hydrolase family protein [Burkholderia pseudomallei]